MTMRRVARATALAAMLLAALVATLFVGRFTGAVDVDPAGVVRDEGLAWRTKGLLLRGAFVSVVAEGDRGLAPVEATLRENGAALARGLSSHADIRSGGAGRWSLWKGQLYFSTPDGSDPTANGRSYRLEGPWRPTMLLLCVALATIAAAVVLIRRFDPSWSATLERLCDLAGTRFDGAGPHPLGSAAPWLLAAAMALACATDRVGEWFAWDFGAQGALFLVPYLGRADAWIGGVLLLAIIASRRAPSVPVVVALLVVISCLVLGGITVGAFNDWQPQWIGAIQGARFSLAFIASWCVVRAGGARAALPAVSLLGAIWIAGVVLAAWRGQGRFIQVGGHFPSFAGMVLGLVAVVAIARGSIAWAVACLVALVATGSRSAAFATGLAVIAILLLRLGARGRWPRPNRAGVVVGAVILVAGVAAIASSSQLRDYLAFKATSASWLSLGRRVDMTQWTIDSLDALGWWWFGRGSGGAAGFLLDARYAETMPENWGNLHVIWLEWIVELGVLAIPLVVLVLWRTIAAWRRGPLPAAIWIFFILSQSIDYWLWTRDGMLVWGLFLGLSEAMGRRGDATAPDEASVAAPPTAPAGTESATPPRLS